MATIWNAIWSLVPHGSPAARPVPKVGDPAPSEPALKGVPSIVAFPRHCGCPFAQKEVLTLGQLSQQVKDFHAVIITHSPAEVTQQWFNSIGGPKAFGEDSSRFTLVSDPSRKLHALWGVGTLGWFNLLDGSAFAKIKELQQENIGVTTFSGSYRWQNSGGFAVDKEGKITYGHIASTSSDMCDYSTAVKTLKV